MKKIYYILLISILFSCGNNEDVKIFSANDMKFNLDNEETIQLWCNSIFSFDALTEGNYEIKSADESVVTVDNIGAHFTLRTHKPGKTEIKILNENDEKVISVNSIGFSGTWREDQILGQFYPNYIGIIVESDSIRNEIEQELYPNHFQRGIEYTFDEDQGNLKVLIPAEGDPIYGKYCFDPLNQSLKLEYDLNVETFYCDIQPFYESNSITGGFPNRFVVALHQDITAHYKLKYPSEIIERVYIIRHIVSLGSWWIARKTM